MARIAHILQRRDHRQCGEPPPWRSVVRARLSAALFAVVAIAALTVASVAPAAGDPSASPGNSEAGISHRPVCPPAPAGQAHCDSEVVTRGNNDATPAATTSYTNGYKPSDLQSAYKLPATGSGQLVAIVDAYDNPNAESDLA